MQGSANLTAKGWATPGKRFRVSGFAFRAPTLRQKRAKGWATPEEVSRFALPLLAEDFLRALPEAADDIGSGFGAAEA
jgi:hypothetical protein